jgi:ABC-type multidrug transport system ATPase subunit
VIESMSEHTCFLICWNVFVYVQTTTLSMLTRHLIPTSGNAFVAGHSVLNDFTRGSTHLGVVTQNNSLWDLLSVQDHLKLFARLRGVPEDIVYQVVDDTIDQLELTPHRAKLAGRLSGGMKRKLWCVLEVLCWLVCGHRDNSIVLCGSVAIALIGDPEVVLLDEPSAGLGATSSCSL